MPKIPIQIAPGLVTEESARGARNRWKNGNRVRFFSDHPEKMGGFLIHTLAGAAILGVVRGAIDWRSLNNAENTAFGTNLRLYHETGDIVENITPYQVATSSFGGAATPLSNPFSTTLDSQIVTVTHAGHSLIEGATVYFDGATAVGGLTIDGEYLVVEVTGTDTYTIDAGSAASSTATGGGTVDYAYEINPGSTTGQAGLGWSVGGWSEGTWSTPRGTSDIIFPARTWSFGTWGEDLIANPRNGGIFYRDTSVIGANRAALLANAPAAAAWIQVSQVDRHLIAFGCTPIGGLVRDPMVIRWCSQNDLADWIPSRVNTAGERRLDSGSGILSAQHVREEMLIHTDTSAYAMSYVGPSATFNIREVGDECGLVGPLAKAAYTGRAFWMGTNHFYVYDGGLSILPCDVRSHVFDDMNPQLADTFHAAVNSEFNEVWFFYVSAGGSEIDRYAAVSVLDGSWSFGELDRTTWLDKSEVRSAPAAFDAAGLFYDHETGLTANGAPLGDFIETWDFEIDPAGEHLFFVNRIVPDMLRFTGGINVTLTGKQYPQSTDAVTRGPLPMSPTTRFIRPRLRARQISMRIESDPAIPETDYRLSTWLAHARQSGRR